MKKLVLGLSLFSALFSYGQSENFVGSSFGFQVEYADFQRGQFNTYLDSKSLPLGNTPDVMYGFDISIKGRQHIVSFDFSTNTNTSEQSNYRVTNSLSSVAFSYGYSLIKKDGWDIYPYIGYRLLTYAYKYEGYDQLATDFESYLTQNTAYVSLENRMHGANVGIGFNINGSVAYSIKVGTQLPYISRRWIDVSTDDKLNGGPDVKSLFYIKTSISFGDYENRSRSFNPDESKN
ncbi:hypothetical protein SAMN05216474_0156 [Lishizhenia tianjinensis]|uniref:Outer membrane protein beta-barrel domain-containing protein n=1 Tax=Lishizhenia tianjinensis TaxID=477690 RepID=A0A1I6XGF0_9FLAO|nr:hypothetical protein [Lishizhenia tianjinensis]SFT36944.1 hypothetical protein SAMN05216474_0156 [Lishizhenia tianjinensis]